MKRGLLVWICGMGLAMGLPAFGAEPATEGVSSGARGAIAELSSDSFKAREKAVGELRAAMGEQLRTLAGAADAASRERVAEALEYQAGLAQWAVETLKLPNEQRKHAVEFGLRSDVVGAIALAFSPNVHKRVEGIGLLAKVDDGEVVTLLSRLIDDPDRQVRVAAMEAVGERKATNEVVELLWNRAVGPNVLWANQTYAMMEMQGGEFMNSMRGVNYQDCDPACTALIKLKSPRVGERLTSAMETIEMMYMKVPAGTAPLLFNTSSGPTKSFFRLMRAYKPKGAMGPLYRVVSGPVGQAITAGGRYWSSRTPYIGEFVELIGEKAEDYKLKQVQAAGGGWTFPTAGDEEEAVGKMRDWWLKHGGEYGGAATAPAEKEP